MMQRLYRKNELHFALIWILIYLLLMSLADDCSRAIGIQKIVTVPVGIGMVLAMTAFLRRSGLAQTFGLCRFRGKAKQFLWFLPLLPILSANLWNGIRLNASVPETILFVISMLCVGFLEEMIFRGFLFRALLKDNVKSAVLVSSITFGAGHLVNLLNGADVAATLLQIGYACALGFLFTVLFHRGKSLWPCILTHGLFNALSAFSIEFDSGAGERLTAAILCVLSLGYAAWILQNTSD